MTDPKDKPAPEKAPETPEERNLDSPELEQRPSTSTSKESPPMIRGKKRFTSEQQAQQFFREEFGDREFPPGSVERSLQDRWAIGKRGKLEHENLRRSAIAARDARDKAERADRDERERIARTTDDR